MSLSQHDVRLQPQVMATLQRMIRNTERAVGREVRVHLLDGEWPPFGGLPLDSCGVASHYDRWEAIHLRCNQQAMEILADKSAKTLAEYVVMILGHELRHVRDTHSDPKYLRIGATCRWDRFEEAAFQASRRALRYYRRFLVLGPGSKTGESNAA